MSAALDRVERAVQASGRKITDRRADSFRTSCPAHDGDGQNVTVRAVNARVAFHCHSAGCDHDAITGAFGLTWPELFDDFDEVAGRRPGAHDAVGQSTGDRLSLDARQQPGKGPRTAAQRPTHPTIPDDECQCGRSVQRFEYLDASGARNRVVHRSDCRSGQHPKRVWQSDVKGAPVLFNLARVLDAVAASRPVWLVEGETSALALTEQGEVATTAPMGAGNFAQVDATPLAGADVRAVVDRDPAGDGWAAQVAATLARVGARVEFWQSATTDHGDDVVDHLAAGHVLDALVAYSPREVAAEQDVATPPGQPADVAAPPEDDRADRAEDLMARLVADEVRKLRARDAAREILAQERARALTLPEPVTLADFLAHPDDPLLYRIDRLLPVGGRAVLSAPHKAGKSTLVGNLVRCLADGADLLDKYPTEQATRVVLLDDELDERMLRRWLREQGIEHPERVAVVPLRGRLSTFNPLDPANRAQWAALLRGADVLVLDCLRPVLDALALSEDKDAGRFLEALDELTADAGVSETVVVHHTGHNGDRSRGDSRIQDWPDVLWQLTRDRADDESMAQADRYFTAYGRDVDEPQQRLAFDPATRHLWVAGGSRIDAAQADALDALLALLDEQAGRTGRQIEAALPTHQRAAVRGAIKAAIRDGLVFIQPGPRGANLHFLTSAPSAPGVRRALADECASAPTEGALSAHTGEDEPRGALDRPCPDCGEPLTSPGLVARCRTRHGPVAAA